MNIGADDGAMPANESDNVRAMVTAGLAKEVEAVNLDRQDAFWSAVGALRHAARS